MCQRSIIFKQAILNCLGQTLFALFAKGYTFFEKFLFFSVLLNFVVVVVGGDVFGWGFDIVRSGFIKNKMIQQCYIQASVFFQNLK